MKKLLERYPILEKCKTDIDSAVQLLLDTYNNGGKVLACGNGGSCADCDHIVGELMKGFLLRREVGDDFLDKLKNVTPENAEYMQKNLQGALPAISLTSQTAILSAFANDVAADMVYAQMVYGYGNKEDVLICLSTSGNSKNVVYAAEIAKVKGVKTLALTGEKESKLSALCDVTIRVPETETFKIQELHLPVYHYLCAEIERRMFA